MSGPDRIWATAYYNQNRSEHVREWATRPYEEKQNAEYVRRDPAVLAALPEVKAMLAEAVAQERERCAKAAQDRYLSWGDESGVECDATACADIAAAIRAGGKT